MDHLTPLSTATQLIMFYCFLFVTFVSVWTSIKQRREFIAEMRRLKAIPVPTPTNPQNVPLDFEEVTTVYQTMTTKAQATFLFRLIQVLDGDGIDNMKKYLDMRVKRGVASSTTRLTSKLDKEIE